MTGVQTCALPICWDIIDHRDVLVISLGLGADSVLLANIHSDAAHTTINLLHKRVLELPKFHLMCGDCNVRRSQWDPEGPENNIYADCLEAVAELPLPSGGGGPHSFSLQWGATAYSHRPHVCAR